MARFKYKFQMYRALQQSLGQIFAEAERAADELGIPAEWRGKFGLTGAISGCPSPLRREIVQASEKGSQEVIPLSKLVDEIRETVKSVYGDEYDACPVNTCEAGLWVTFDVLCTPPMQGRGDNYRTRYVALYEKHMHHQAGYGRPFPAKYKDFLADRGCTAGELGFYAKRQNNLDTVVVPLAGARYPNHGIKYYPVPLLLDVDPVASADAVRKAARRHEEFLSGFVSLGYDTPGYGYGAKADDGSPLLQKKLGEIAREYDVPYIVDNAWGLPFVGTDPRKVGADVMIYSMDKATGSATSGLIIGKEDVMAPIRRALGMHGDRWGTLASYGKAGYVTQDPGKEALVTQVAALKTLRDSPETILEPLDQVYRIVLEEVESLPQKLRDALVITKSPNSGAVEVNYERTWADDGSLGYPIFSIEDMYAGSHVLQAGLSRMGIIPTIAYDANIMISPGMGTCDQEGRLVEEKMRLAVRGLIKLMEIVGRYAGFFD